MDIYSVLWISLQLVLSHVQHKKSKKENLNKNITIYTYKQHLKKES